MGYYIQCDDGRETDKGTWLFDHCDAKLLASNGPPETVPKGYVPVCVVDNGGFEAAAIAFNKKEMEEFADKKDKRPKQWFLVPRDKAIEHCNDKSVAWKIAW